MSLVHHWAVSGTVTWEVLGMRLRDLKFRSCWGVADGTFFQEWGLSVKLRSHWEWQNLTLEIRSWGLCQIAWDRTRRGTGTVLGGDELGGRTLFNTLSSTRVTLETLLGPRLRQSSPNHSDQALTDQHWEPNLVQNSARHWGDMLGVARAQRVRQATRTEVLGDELVGNSV
jgi:hypothetical protein